MRLQSGLLRLYMPNEVCDHSGRWSLVSLRLSPTHQRRNGPAQDAVLYELGNTANTQCNASVCGWTCAQLADSTLADCVCSYIDTRTVHTCPQHCLRYVGRKVFGSYPYHGNSSVCLAAIQAGVIGNEEGGGVMARRFFSLT